MLKNNNRSRANTKDSALTENDYDNENHENENENGEGVIGMDNGHADAENKMLVQVGYYI